jgi:hypothetical protein
VVEGAKDSAVGFEVVRDGGALTLTGGGEAGSLALALLDHGESE